MKMVYKFPLILGIIVLGWLSITQPIRSYRIVKICYPPPAVTPPGPTFDTIITEVSVSKYTWTGSRMSSGKWPYEGAVAISDFRLVPIGSIVIVDSIRYRVEDGVPRHIHNIHGLTVDIYDSLRSDCLKWGRKKRLVTILVPSEKS